MRLQDQCLVISDMTSAAGIAMIHAFAGEGAQVVFGGVDPEKGHRLQELLEGTGANTEFAKIDPCDESSVQSLIGDVIMRFGRIDGVVLNHSLQHSREGSGEVGDALQNELLIAQYAAPFLSASANGSVLLVSNEEGLGSGDSLAGTCRALASLWAPQRIRVNGVLAGNLIESSEGDGSSSHIEAAIKSIPLGRLGKPEDVALPCAFLLSMEASFITGAVLRCDGGSTLS